MMQTKKTLIITGVPGTGKSSVAKLIAEKTGAALVDMNKIVEVLKLYDEIDEEDGSKIVRLKELEHELSKSIRGEKRDVVAEGHLGCEMKLPASKVIVLRCEPRTLRQRLSGRGYTAEKIAGNALSEALDYCTVMSEKNYGRRKVWELDTTGKTIGQVASEAEKIFLGKAGKTAHVSFPEALMREAISGEKIRKLKGIL
jgi:adenylate kinase